MQRSLRREKGKCDSHRRAATWRKGFDILSHRERMVKDDMEEKFKNPDLPFGLVFVCAMWLIKMNLPQRRKDRRGSQRWRGCVFPASLGDLCESSHGMIVGTFP
jgi:hypothetical protein